LFGDDIYCDGELSDSDIPLYMRSDQNKVYLKFVSDITIVYRGFAITFTSSSSACGGDLSGFKGALTSPGYGVNYGQEYSCEWAFKPTTVDKHLVVDFTDFETEFSADCERVDYIKFTNGATNNVYGLFCGNTKPLRLVLPAENLIINFVSNDDNNEFKGFRLTFIEVGSSFNQSI